MSPRVTTLKSNKENRNTKIREEFHRRYTEAKRPRMYSREYVISQLAQEYYLSMATIEDIVYSKVEKQAA
ncbi:hypothetical protein [Hymenobacter sp. YC55]|uniref:hypothetical protein n=1 Tax=Hymenobacter sp. YC55 TaxID=3034019 RepID=UPI0023F833A1|nr:hypothetical protein [Hymenobacter sp. YC55]MDF7813626.1 hypothetical protein [Hymenobacter sp. YC55]